MESDIRNILNFIKNQRAYDFTGYQLSMLSRRIQKRLNATNNKNFDDYFEYLKSNPDELDNLFDVLTINVSRFFRDTFPFEYLSKIITPKLITTKIQTNDNLRIWSAGCSYGEEPYSIAIIINEFLKKEKKTINLNIFATDVDKNAIKTASEAKYRSESLKDMKFAFVEKYFTKEHDYFKLNSEIKKMVQFSFFDLLDKKHFVPPESVFGNFDIVLCRNVLIYFNTEYQIIILEKLYKSLSRNGYLILGEEELPGELFKTKFKRKSKICKIYKKID